MDPRRPLAPDPWPRAVVPPPRAPEPAPGAAGPYAAGPYAAAPNAHAPDAPRGARSADGGPAAVDTPAAVCGPAAAREPAVPPGPAAAREPAVSTTPGARPADDGLPPVPGRPRASTRAPAEDAALEAAITRARRGDATAFDTIASLLAPPLTRYATVILGGDGASADDVVQDALVAGWLALPTLRAPHRLRGWMFSVTHRKAMSWLRYRGIRRSDPLIDDSDREDEPHAPAPPPPASAEEEARADLYRALGSIPVRYVGPLTLCYLEGLGLRETARVLALAPNTLKMRLHRGRALLRRKLARLEGWRPHRHRPTAEGPASAAVEAPPAATRGRTTPATPPRLPLDDTPRRSPA